MNYLMLAAGLILGEVFTAWRQDRIVSVEQVVSMLLYSGLGYLIGYSSGVIQ